MGSLCGAKPGISKLSQLEIDADKDWNLRGIFSLKEVALNMAFADMIYRGGVVPAPILKILGAGYSGQVLHTAGPAAAPFWDYPPGYDPLFPKYHCEILGQAFLEIAEPLTKAITSPISTDVVASPTPLEQAEVGLSKNLASVTPDQSKNIAAAVATVKVASPIPTETATIGRTLTKAAKSADQSKQIAAAIASIYEQPPEITTDPADNIGANGARLNETLDSMGTCASVHVSFEWGLTVAYGNETPGQDVVATGAYNETIGGLAPSETYHFRAKAVGQTNPVYGADREFTTTA